MTSENKPKILAVIPARMASERFPGKVLAPLCGKPLVWHVFDRTQRASLVSDVVVAADDVCIVEALEPLGVPVVLTRNDHVSGTDRIAEVAAGADAEFIVNVQGDEAMIDPETIDATVQALLEDPQVSMATARHRITDVALIHDPNVVKVVCDARGHALYFSRSAIPYDRDAGGVASDSSDHWQHIGLYAFRRQFLLDFASMKPTPLEQLEKLEQLRAIENGHSIAVVDTEYEGIGVDTPEELERVRTLLTRS